MSNNIKEEIVSLNETLLEELELDAEGLENVRGGAFTFARLGTTTLGQLRGPIAVQSTDCTAQCTGNCVVNAGLGITGTSVFTRINPSSILGGGLGRGTLGGL